jgi:AGCS family alanine or glycine:cation symporter
MIIQEKIGIDERINEAFQPISNFWEGLILHEFFGTGIPTIIFLLVGGAAFFTLYFGFINIRGFGLSIRTVMGRYDGLDEKRSGSGEVSHFQALATAVSGTVGNGNIAGVAMAIAIGGPGATFWMILCGLLGMSSKFVECTLGVKYRDVGPDGTIYGGPMYYLSKGLKERGFEKFGKVLAVIFAVLCIGASFGGGNAAQSNQAALQISSMFGMSGGSAGTLIGITLAVLVGIVITEAILLIPPIITIPTNTAKAIPIKVPALPPDIPNIEDICKAA